MSAELVARRNEERHFLEQLLDGKRVDDFKLPVAVNAELRAYQQVGIILCTARSWFTRRNDVDSMNMCFPLHYSTCRAGGNAWQEIMMSHTLQAS